jgi:hypothetical protein
MGKFFLHHRQFFAATMVQTDSRSRVSLPAFPCLRSNNLSFHR